MILPKSFFLKAGVTGKLRIASFTSFPISRKYFSGVAWKLAALTSFKNGKSLGNMLLKITLPTVVSKYCFCCSSVKLVLFNALAGMAIRECK